MYIFSLLARTTFEKKSILVSPGYWNIFNYFYQVVYGESGAKEIFFLLLLPFSNIETLLCNKLLFFVLFCFLQCCNSLPEC